jgi:hypothetical protein|tara:strand:+ start:239 stop:445 length:207 start_codon:yes stop_codon:yes gene_type:complete
MLVEVHFTGNQFIAYDPSGNQITNSTILNEVAMMPYTGTKGVYVVDVNVPVEQVPSTPLTIKINTIIE